MIRFLKKTTILSVAVIITIIMATGLVVFTAPHLLINDWTLNHSKAFTKRIDCEVDWHSAAASAKSESFFLKSIKFAFSNFMVKCAHISFEAPQIDFGFQLSLRPAAVRFPRIGPILVKEAKLVVGKASDPPARDEEGFNFQKLLRFLKDTRIEASEIQLTRWQIEASPSPLVGRFYGTLERRDSSQTRVSLKLNADPGAAFKSIDMDGIFEATPDDAALHKSQMSLSAVFYDGKRLSANLQLIPSNQDRADYNLAASGTVKGIKGLLSSKGSVSRDGLNGSVTLSVTPNSGPVQSLALSDCRLSVQSSDIFKEKMTADLDCQGMASVKHPPPGDSPIALLLPHRFGFRFSNSVVAAAPSASGRLLDFSSRISLEDIQMKHLSVSGGVKTLGQIDLQNLKAPHRLVATFDTVARVAQFQTLVARLKGSTWMIPAPANQLQGVVSCSASGTVDLIKSSLAVPLSCQTDLESPKQKVLLSSSASLRANKDGDEALVTLDSEVILRDVRLILPDIDLTKPLPHLTRDKRVAAGSDAVVKNKATVNYHVHVLTPPGKSVFVENNLSHQPVGIQLDLKLSNRLPPEGRIDVSPFDVSILRRKATLESMSLAFRSQQEAPEIKGRVRIPGNVYDVYVSLFGTIAKPGYEVYSEPPLPEREALAVLLFGYEPDLMAADEMRSADEMQAAMADGAISLVSMFFLSSTPVESIGYNSYTGLFSARVKVREGVSLMVGSSADETGVIGLRKRVSRNWAVEATATKSGEGEETTSGRAMLRWSKRF